MGKSELSLVATKNACLETYLEPIRSSMLKPIEGRTIYLIWKQTPEVIVFNGKF
jgi:hypothetical protein